MEVVVVVAVIAVIIVLLGISASLVAKAMLIISSIVLAAMFVFFVVMTVMLIISKKAEGEFDGFEKTSEENTFETAWYRIGEDRLKNIFPAENVLRSKIYQGGVHKMRRLRLGRHEFAIDGHSIVIILLGLWLTAISMGLVAYVLKVFEL